MGSAWEAFGSRKTPPWRPVIPGNTVREYRRFHGWWLRPGWGALLPGTQCCWQGRVGAGGWRVMSTADPPQALLSTEAPESKRSPGHFWGASGEGRREVPGRGAETPATLARPALGWVSRTRPDPCHSGGLVKGPGGLREAPLAGRSRLRLIISPKPPPHCRLLNVRPSGCKCWHFSWCVPLSPCSPMSS